LQYWLLKSEPADYSFDDLVRDGLSEWDGVTANPAQLQMRQMQMGDVCVIYHTGDQRQAIGLAFDGPRDKPAPNPVGFEFRFSRTANSVGYSSASSAAYSIYRVRLDVRPVTLGWPSYQYR
jgi:hypothetical protein